jgi:hypothetical protein
MTDRELLELAAKAAGMNAGEATWHPRAGFVWVKRVDGTRVENRWNPLTDDGDALRLAVKLRLGISLPVHQTIRADVIAFTNSAVNAREEGNDPYAATRRAIVRAAAEIGRGME